MRIFSQPYISWMLNRRYPDIQSAVLDITLTVRIKQLFALLILVRKYGHVPSYLINLFIDTPNIFFIPEEYKIHII